MVVARLSPTPAQHHAAEDLVQQVLLALTTGVARLENRTVGGLKAFASGIVSKQVALLLRQKRRAGYNRDSYLLLTPPTPSDSLPSCPAWPESSSPASRTTSHNAETTARTSSSRTTLSITPGHVGFPTGPIFSKSLTVVAA